MRAFDSALPGVVAQKGPRTHLVDMHSALTTNDIADGIHPTAAGYDKMAARWYDVIRSVPVSLVPAIVPPVGFTGLLSNAQSNRCLDIAGLSTTDGTRVQLWTCNGGPAQRFTFSGGGTVVAAGSGKCIDVDHNGTDNGSVVQLWTCHNTGAQRWFAR